MDRDRDPTGRARNARPRDASGRPLPPGAEGVAPVDDDVVRDPEETLGEAQRLIDGGYPFFAHEVLEAAWKATTGPERDLWQGLAQLAVGLTHVQRDNPRGAAALLRRAAGRIEPYGARAPHGLDVTALGQHARTLADLIDDRGIGALAATQLRVALRPRDATAGRRQLP